MHCVCEHVIGCNWSLTNSTHCYTLETTPEWNALTYSQLNACTALKCLGGYIACGYCGYIASVETVDTLPLERQRSGTMVTCVCCSQPHFSCFLFMKGKNRMLTSGADISHFFKTEEKNHNADISRFLKRKKYNADIWSWHCWLRKKLNHWHLRPFFGRKPFQAWRHNWWLIEHIDKVTKLLLPYFVAVFLQHW